MWHSVAAAPSFEGEGESLSDFVQGPELRRRVANLDVTKRAAATVSQMGQIAGGICTACGGDQLFGAWRGGQDYVAVA